MRLVFDEEISAKPADSFFTVTDGSGAAVGTGKLDTADLDHKTLVGALKSGLANGVYTVTWQTITVDDNGKSSGSFSFGVNVDPAQAAATPTATPAATPPATATPAPAPSALPPTGGGASDALGALALLAGVLAGLGALAWRRLVSN